MSDLDAARESLEELAELLTQEGHLGERLVLLEEIPRAELRGALLRLDGALLRRHPPAWDPVLQGAGARRLPGVAAPEVLLREHEIFPASLEQLRWLFDLCGRDGHGGNRQALGQYWKLLAEAVARHLAEESRYLPERSALPPRGANLARER